MPGERRNREGKGAEAASGEGGGNFDCCPPNLAAAAGGRSAVRGSRHEALLIAPAGEKTATIRSVADAASPISGRGTFREGQALALSCPPMSSTAFVHIEAPDGRGTDLTGPRAGDRGPDVAKRDDDGLLISVLVRDRDSSNPVPADGFLVYGAASEGEREREREV